MSSTTMSSTTMSSGAVNYRKLKASGYMADFDPVASGGFNRVFKLSEDPKAYLMEALRSSYSGTSGIESATASTAMDVKTCMDLLAGESKGYDSEKVAGSWVLVYSQNSKKSPSLQKLIGKSEKIGRAFSNFDTSSFTFDNLSYTKRGNGVLKATVEYQPTGEGFSKSESGEITVRRIKADITDVSFKYKSLPTLPIPLKKKGGYLDFLYLDDDLRITKGNRGGVFVHVRKEMIDSWGLS